MAQKQVGKIEITVFEGGMCEAKFIGDIPMNAPHAARFAMQQGLHKHLSSIADSKKKEVEENKRTHEIKRAAAEQEARKLELAKQKLLIEHEEKLTKARELLAAAQGKTTAGMNPQQLQQNAVIIGNLEKNVIKLEAK